MFTIAFSLQKDKNIFLKLTIVEYNFYNNSFGFIIPDSCDTDIRQFFSGIRGAGTRPPPPLVEYFSKNSFKRLTLSFFISLQYSVPISRGLQCSFMMVYYIEYKLF